jgi:hypothetical protein
MPISDIEDDGFSREAVLRARANDKGPQPSLAPRPQAGPEHGKVSTYKRYNCRCLKCKDAMREANARPHVRAANAAHYANYKKRNV